jgi:hypothetical protein
MSTSVMLGHAAVCIRRRQSLLAWVLFSIQGRIHRLGVCVSVGEVLRFLARRVSDVFEHVRLRGTRVVVFIFSLFEEVRGINTAMI